jgi:phosphopantetheinyl transferase
MKVFYIEKEKFLNSINKTYLKEFSDGRQYENNEKYIEHLCGIFLTKFMAKKFYNINNTEIEIINKKPHFKQGDLHFSISHSQNIVAVGFSKKNIGLDIEYMRNRDYKKLLHRYNQNIENPTKEDFYKFWTQYEATIKLGEPSNSSYSKVFAKNYMLSCVSVEKNLDILEIEELSYEDFNLDLIEEF